MTPMKSDRASDWPMLAAVKPIFFASSAEWRRWLVAHHDREDVLWVGFHKRASGRSSITWPESVDEALCFGWIDGLRKRIDAASYAIRFTPRRAGSTWSAVNVKRVATLIARRRMRSAGLAAFRMRTRKKTGIYSFEQRLTASLPVGYLARLKKNAAAWRFFASQAPWYQRTVIWWIVSAKREETRLKRLTTLIEDSALGTRIGPLRR
jgi:uncharacterized protein YdeI (YjbR/CyaY-like superfamily)